MQGEMCVSPISQLTHGAIPDLLVHPARGMYEIRMIMCGLPRAWGLCEIDLASDSKFCKLIWSWKAQFAFEELLEKSSSHADRQSFAFPVFFPLTDDL